MDKKTIAKFHVLAIICIIIFSAVMAPKTLQNDTFYTISIGEHIMENGIDRHINTFCNNIFLWENIRQLYGGLHPTHASFTCIYTSMYGFRNIFLMFDGYCFFFIE